MMLYGGLALFLIIFLFVGWLIYKNCSPPPFNAIVFRHPDNIIVKPEQIQKDPNPNMIPSKQGGIIDFLFGSSQPVTTTTIRKVKQDYLSTAYACNRSPDGTRRPFWYNHAWYYFGLKPLWFWAEEKVETKDESGNVTKVEYPIKSWEPPETPIDYNIRKANPEPAEEYRRERMGIKNLNLSYVTPNALYDNTDWECAKRFETVKGKWTEAVKLGASVVMVIACIIGIFLLVSSVNENKAKELNQPGVPANLQPHSSILQDKELYIEW